MSYEKEFKKFLNKDGNGYLAFLEWYATMDNKKLLDKEGYLFHQAQQHTILALGFLAEYEKANYAKYLHSLDFDMVDFTYAECIAADINFLFKELSGRAYKRAIRDCERLMRYLQDGNKNRLKNNVFIG